MPSPGKIEEFDLDSTNIERYLEQLEQYFVANCVLEDSTDRHKCRVTLISVMGAKAYNVLSDLCSPWTPSQKTYAQLATSWRTTSHQKKPGNCWTLQISQLHTTRGRKCGFVRSQPKTSGGQLSVRPSPHQGLAQSTRLWTQQQRDSKETPNRGTQFWWSTEERPQLRSCWKRCFCVLSQGSTTVNKLGKGNCRHSHPPRHPKSPGKGQGKSNSPPNNST